VLILIHPVMDRREKIDYFIPDRRLLGNKVRK